MPTFAMNDNGSIIQIIYNSLKYTNMKTVYLAAAIIVMMTFASCSADGNDPVDNTTQSTFLLEKTYGAIRIAYDENQPGNVDLNDLPVLSLSEADAMLSAIRRHTNAQEDYDLQATTQGDKTRMKISMKHTLNYKYYLSLRLNIDTYSDGNLYYSGYQAECSSLMKWNMKGFSFASDKESKHFKFESKSYLYIKVVSDGVQYMQVPVTVNGNYNPENQNASFQYTL